MKFGRTDHRQNALCQPPHGVNQILVNDDLAPVAQLMFDRGSAHLAFVFGNATRRCWADQRRHYHPAERLPAHHNCEGDATTLAKPIRDHQRRWDEGREPKSKPQDRVCDEHRRERVRAARDNEPGKVFAFVVAKAESKFLSAPRLEPLNQLGAPGIAGVSGPCSFCLLFSLKRGSLASTQR